MSDKTHSCLESDVGAVYAINNTLDLLLRFRHVTFDVRRSLQQVVVSLPMIKNMALKWINPAITFDVLQKIQPFL